MKPGRQIKRSYSGAYMSAGAETQTTVMEWLRTQPWVSQVKDHTNNMAMQSLEIDCTVILPDKAQATVEIKRDSHLGVSGNVLFELLRTYHNSYSPFGLGWGGKTCADYFLLHAISVNKVYMCLRSDLQECAQKYLRENTRDVRFVTIPTDADCTTVALLIPWSTCASIFTVYDLVVEDAEDFLDGVGV